MDSGKQSGKLISRRLRPLVTSFMMGFTAGLPLAILITLLQAWLEDGGISLTLIGLLAMTGLPYSLKFLWSPWLDYIAPFGRRRQSWLLMSQIALFALLWTLSKTNPLDFQKVLYLALAISFASATQDIAVDAYRREDLTDPELPAGSAMYMWGYRLGMTAVSGGLLALAEPLGWEKVFQLGAFLIFLGPVTLLFSPEPLAGRLGRPLSLKESVLKPLGEFFRRPNPFLILGFVFFYRFGEQFVSSINTAFFLKAGYTKLEIGLVVKAFGLASTLGGISLAGYLMRKWGLIKCLWLFGWLQIFNCACLMSLWILPPQVDYLAFFITLDHLSVGGGAAVFVAFLTSLTNVSYTATQYALLSSLMALPRSVMSSPSGFLAENLGWPFFYGLGACMTLPGLWLLKKLISKGQINPLTPET
ncbi:MAG: MFS transporter [Deltaproteobacteria bacterium]|jgi:PAT family beta-lactamase induction signal transducer AmpG|nr:MFS transporter [Deltaproteobacteria bacterium]